MKLNSFLSDIVYKNNILISVKMHFFQVLNSSKLYMR